MKRPRGLQTALQRMFCNSRNSPIIGDEVTPVDYG